MPFQTRIKTPRFKSLRTRYGHLSGKFSRLKGDGIRRTKNLRSMDIIRKFDVVGREGRVVTSKVANEPTSDLRTLWLASSNCVNLLN